MDEPKKAVIVVHGIGDQRQGDTLERLATSYAVHANDASARATEVRKSTVQLRSHVDSGKDRRLIDNFKADVLTVDHLPNVLFAEVYWADISRILGGLSGFLLGVLQILTGLRFVVEAAGKSLVERTKSPAAALVQLIGYLINRTLVGPLVSLNALLLFVVVTTSWFEGMIGQYVAFGVFSGAFLLFINLMAEHRYVADETKRDAIISYVFFAAILLVRAIFDGIFQETTDQIVMIEWFSDVFWSALSVASFVLIVISIPVFLLHRNVRPTLAIACAGPCLNVGTWALALSNLWIFGFQNILPGLEKHTQGEEGLVVGLFPLLSLLWAAVVILALVLGLVFSIRQHKASKHQKVPGEGLRLIFSSWGVGVLIFVITLWFIVTMHGLFPAFLKDILGGLNEIFQAWTLKYVWLVVIIIGVLVAFASGRVSRALDLLLDIITYFRRDSSGAHIRPFAEQGTEDAQEPMPHSAYLKRELIADRFRCLVNDVIRRQGVSALTVMAHSQGTIPVIEQLNTIGKWLGTPVPPIELITIGSPYSHIYQHYFPDRFPTPELQHVQKWINIYTVDDYVGTEVDDRALRLKNIEREQVAKSTHPEGVKPIGHNGYWSDEVVMQIIKKEVPLFSS